MLVLASAATGLAAGTHIATWGMYKDCIHEGFTFRRYSRSIMVGTAAGTIAGVITRLPEQGVSGLLVLFGVTYAVERACTEFYKTFLRDEDQSKYFIPMQWSIGGRLVHGRRQRLLAGLAAAGLALLLATATVLIARAPVPVHPLALVLTLGSLGGWFSAVGGAMKDAPFEGFELLKFFRSPLLAAAWAFLLFRFTDDILLIGLGALGYTVATLETYKTFFFPSKPRGKFAGKPILHPRLVRGRNRAVPLYVGLWTLLIAGFAHALLTEV